MERGALRIFTSCAWFFDDIGGLEPIEVLRYAARAIELAGPAGARLEEAFLARLADARSNDPALGTGRDIYLAMAKPKIGQLARLAASVAAAQAIAATDPRSRQTGRALDVETPDGKVLVRQHRTGERETFDVTVTGLPSADGAAANGNGQWSPAMIAATLVAPPVDVALTDMTERQRSVVEDGIRQRLIETAFGAGAAALNSRPASEVLPNAVTSAITALAAESSAHLTGRLRALLDLLELEHLHIPFDAQTRFYESFLAGHTVPLDGDLAAIALRLGFARPELVT
jgi:hypothetical protein